MKKAKSAILISAAVVLTLAVLFALLYFIFLRDTRPEADLHEAGQVGYISYDENEFELDLKSKSVFIYDLNNDKMVFYKGENKVVYPASTTKLLTALYALEIMEPDRLISPSDELDLVENGSSIAYIKKGHTLTLEMLIEGMLIPSGNDAAFAIAAEGGRVLYGKELSGKRAVELFMESLNEYGRSIGLCGTAFVSPDGYSGGEHYSTVEDMAIVARLAYENEIISKYVAMFEDDVTYASGETNTWKNTNLLLDKNSKYYNPYADGMKTGSLENNYCLICSVQRDGKAYIIGIFGAGKKNDRFEDADKIIDLLLGE